MSTQEMEKLAKSLAGKLVGVDSLHVLLQERNSLQDQRDFAMGEIERLRKERDEARGALEAQDKRMEIAGKQCGVPFVVFGCDWPDRVAEKLNAVADERNAERKSKLEIQQERDALRDAINALHDYLSVAVADDALGLETPKH